MKRKQSHKITDKERENNLYTYSEVCAMMDLMKYRIKDKVDDDEPLESVLNELGDYWLEMNKASSDDILKYCAESNDDIDTELAEHFRYKDRLDGYFVFKVDSLVKRIELEEFINERIFPYYNEQEALTF